MFYLVCQVSSLSFIRQSEQTPLPFHVEKEVLKKKKKIKDFRNSNIYLTMKRIVLFFSVIFFCSPFKSCFVIFLRLSCHQLRVDDSVFLLTPFTKAFIWQNPELVNNCNWAQGAVCWNSLHLCVCLSFHSAVRGFILYMTERSRTK